jgi:transposase
VALEKSLDRKPGLSVESGRISTVEVVMRPPSVFVRPLLHEEAVRLKRLSRRAKHQSTRQRASVLLAWNVRMPVPRIAEMWRTDPSWVRKVIHEFNERGMDSLRPRYRGGRPRRITTDQRQRIVGVAGARPDAQGIPLTRWSLPRLAHHLAGEGIEVSPRHLGTLMNLLQSPSSTVNANAVSVETPRRQTSRPTTSTYGWEAASSAIAVQ